MMVARGGGVIGRERLVGDPELGGVEVFARESHLAPALLGGVLYLHEVLDRVVGHGRDDSGTWLRARSVEQDEDQRHAPEQQATGDEGRLAEAGGGGDPPLVEGPVDGPPAEAAVGD